MEILQVEEDRGLEVGVAKSHVGKCQVGTCRGHAEKSVSTPPSVNLILPFPIQLPREPLLFSACYVLGLRCITVNS